MQRPRWLVLLLSALIVTAVALPASGFAAGPAVERPQTGDCGIAAHWAAAYACDLKVHGIMTGDAAGFRLDDTLTRAEFVTLLVRAVGKAPEAGVSFNDVTNHWSAGFVKAAVSAGILPAPGSKPFRPDERIPRQEAVALLVRALGTVHVADMDMEVLSRYQDAGLIGPEDRDAMVFALLHGVVQGRPDKRLDPNGTLTRGEAAKLISTAIPELVPAGQAKLTLLLYNDFHGHLEGDARQRSGLDVGAERLTTAILGQALKNPDMVLIDGGDTFQGTPVSNLVEGQSVEEWRNLVGVRVATMGNHEFDWKQETMVGLMKGADFPVISANIFNEGTETRPDWAVPTATVKAGGFTLGIIGITTPETRSIVLADHIAGLEFRDPAPVINAEAKKLREAGADLVIVVAHAPVSPGKTDPFQAVSEVADFMKNVTEPITAVTGGHSHEETAGYVLDGAGRMVPVVQAGSYGRALAKIDLYVDKATRTLLRAVPQVWEPSQLLAPSPAVSALIARWTKQVAPIQSRPIGQMPRALSRKTTNAGESALGDFIADGMLAAAPGVTIALMNGGGIRADVEPDAQGKVTWGQWYTVQPFGNTIVTVEMTGAQLKATLEQGVENYVRQVLKQPSSHQPIQVAGIRFTYDFAKPNGSRIDPANLKLADGTPVDLNATYKVAVNNFMAGGGDDFATLKELKAKQVDLGIIDLDATIQWFQQAPTAKWAEYAKQDRIQVVNFPG